jgi:hypothetical protein
VDWLWLDGCARRSLPCRFWNVAFFIETPNRSAAPTALARAPVPQPKDGGFEVFATVPAAARAKVSEVAPLTSLLRLAVLFQRLINVCT